MGIENWVDSDAYFTICQYTECADITGTKCVFPFVYKGRKYDTCISIDGRGDGPTNAWCSSETELTGKHIIGKEITCSSNCRVADCPIGYYWQHHGLTCWRVYHSAVFFCFGFLSMCFFNHFSIQQQPEMILWCHIHKLRPCVTQKVQGCCRLGRKKTILPFLVPKHFTLATVPGIFLLTRTSPQLG